MIKINLLESVTDRPQGVAAVEDKVSSPRIQTLLLALTVFGLMVLAMGYDYVSSNRAHTAAQNDLEKDERDSGSHRRDQEAAGITTGPHRIATGNQGALRRRSRSLPDQC